MFKKYNCGACIKCFYCPETFYSRGFSKSLALRSALSMRAEHFYDEHFEGYKLRFKNIVNEISYNAPVSFQPVFTFDFKQQNLVFP